MACVEKVGSSFLLTWCPFSLCVPLPFSVFPFIPSEPYTVPHLLLPSFSPVSRVILSLISLYISVPTWQGLGQVLLFCVPWAHMRISPEDPVEAELASCCNFTVHLPCETCPPSQES